MSAPCAFTLYYNDEPKPGEKKAEGNNLIDGTADNLEVAEQGSTQIQSTTVLVLKDGNYIASRQRMRSYSLVINIHLFYLWHFLELDRMAACRRHKSLSAVIAKLIWSDQCQESNMNLYKECLLVP